jgi:hypothetical protein
MTNLTDKLAAERARPARYGPGYGVPAGAYAALLDVAEAAVIQRDRKGGGGALPELVAALARLDEVLHD